MWCPQGGSIMGPFLFVTKPFSIMELILIADDTNIFTSGSDLDKLVEHVNGELEKITRWFRLNMLLLQLKRTNYIAFALRGRRTTLKDLDVKIDNIKIERVNSTKFLGVVVSDNVSWTNI